MSSARITWRCFVLLILASGTTAISRAQEPSAPQANSRHAAPAAPASVKSADLGLTFQHGQDALTHGRLDEAEQDFRQVLAADPTSGGAYANLGVVYMRRKQWSKALEMLHQADRLMPQVAGIRLNIGLAYYRQNEYLKATPPFESVVRDQPDALQPRYLLGLCYFFAERWADAVTTLEPLWAQESGQLPYLYVVANAAHRAHRKDLDDRATEQLLKIGDGSAEYRMFVGKYYLNLQQYDEALKEFQAAADADPKLPFVHFNLGLTHLKQGDYQQAREEFLKDAAIEPDLALNHDELGEMYRLMNDEANAEKSYREALRRDPKLVSSYVGLAKIYQHQEKYTKALAEIDVAGKIDPARSDVHYVRGRVLLKLGRKEEAKKELAAAMAAEHRAEGEKTTDDETVPSPELLQEPQ